MSITAAKKREQAAQELLGVEAIDGSILWTTGKRLFAFIRVRGMDNSLIDEEDHEVVTDALAAALSEQTQPWQLLSVPRAIDTQGMARELEQMRQSSDDPMRCRLIDGELDALGGMVRSGAKEPLICVKIWAAAAPDADRELLARARAMRNRLEENRIAAYVMDDAQIRQLCAIYAELGVWQDAETDCDVPMLPDRQRLVTRRAANGTLARAELFEQIVPTSLTFARDSLMIGSTRCRCYAVTRYPAELSYGWAVALMQAVDCVSCITFAPGGAEIGDALSRSVSDARRDARSERDVREQKRLERRGESGEALLDDLDARGMALGQISIVVMPFGENDAELETACKRAASRYAAKRMRLKPLTYLQAEAWRHLSPYYPVQERITGISQRVIPLQTLVGGYPCTVSTLRDDHGAYFARTDDGGIVALDIRVRDQSRTNGHGIVTGVSGIGKSTMLKHLLESAYMQGMRCIVIDPEREFRDICTGLDGAWWDAGGGRSKINLLQVQLPVLDEEDEAAKQEKDAMLPLPQHISYVLTILQYRFSSLSEIQVQLLEDALWELYAAFGMHRDDPWEAFAAKTPTDYPIFSDYWKQLHEMEQKDARYADLALLLKSMATGAVSPIWNGHTNIDLGKQLVVIDTKNLYTDSLRDRAAQYYNLLRLVFSSASADKETPYFIVCDEAQLMFDPELPQVARSVKNMADRLRKYEGCLWLSFRSLRELQDAHGDGQTIIDGAAYKILFGTDGENLTQTVDLFRLTHAEEVFLKRKQRGRALAIIGDQHLKLDFQIPRYKLELMGSGGGR